MVQGRSRHPRSQGMIEQAYINVSKKIAAMILENGSDKRQNGVNGFLRYAVSKK